MPTPPLTSLSREALEKLAKQRRIPGAAGLTKAQLLQALQSTNPQTVPRSKPAAKPASTRSSEKKAARPAPATKGSARRPPSPVVPPLAPLKSPAARPRTSPPTPVAAAAAPPAKAALEPHRREIALGNPRTTKGQNSLVATACDAHWIRVTWHLSRDSVDRAQSRLGTEWHRAVPVLRVSRVTTSDLAAGSEAFAKDVIIDTPCNTHYLAVPQPGRAFRVQIGYLGKQGTFFSMAKSNVCHLPKPGPAQLTRESLPSSAPEGGELLTDASGGDDDSPVRPLGFSALSHFGPSASQKRLTGEFQFKLATELVVHGSTRPGSQVTVQGDQVELRDDGSFTFRIPQPEGRQVLAFTAMDPRGNERRMIVMAVERNTKELERQYFDGGHVDGAED
jgi:hypothetical protein